MHGTQTLAHNLTRVSSSVRTAAPWVRRLDTHRHTRRMPQQDSWETPSRTMFPGTRSSKLARVEAVLFSVHEPLTSRRLAQAANLSNAAEARALVRELQSYYDTDESAFTVETVANGWQLRTRLEFASWLDKLNGSIQVMRLSQPALETLAIVSYRQPILRADIEGIRGVACGEMLRQLMERGLVKIAGHHDSLGRPRLYGTTRKFLELFGLANLDHLPMAKELRTSVPTSPKQQNAIAAESEPEPDAAPPVTSQPRVLPQN